MIGNLFVPLLLLTCLAEGLSQNHPRRATRLKKLRQLIVIAWIAWVVQHSWSSSSLTPGMEFNDVFSTRLCLIAFLGTIVWLAFTGLLESRWVELRTLLISINTVVAATFALIMGATIDWNASLPLGTLWALVSFGSFAHLTWKMAGQGRWEGAHLHRSQPQIAASSVPEK